VKCWGKYLVQKSARNQRIQRTAAKTFAADEHMHGKGVARAGRMVRLPCPAGSKARQVDYFT
jgi:hypothetical protein